MARPLRIEFPGAFYHITARGNERKPLFRHDADRQRFLAQLADAVERFHVLVHAYALMDNHYHLLAETLEANLARAMRQLNGDYAQHFNRIHRRVGHLFQARYKAVLVDRDTYLVELSRYIHLNPVRAGMVRCADEYPWSSARAYVGAQGAPAFLTVAEVLGHFGRTPRRAQPRYREFLRDAADRQMRRSPLDQVVGQVLLGAPDWVGGMRQRIDKRQVAGGVDHVDGSEVPAVRQLRIRPTLEQLIEVVGNTMRVDRAAICSRHSRSKARAVVLYLAYAVGGLPQKQIGAALGVGRYAVSKAALGIRRELAHNRRLRRLVKRLGTPVASRSP
jgi:REP-associated tyrosine transposase